MTIVEIPLPALLGPMEAERAVEAALADTGLQIRHRGTVKQFPGCIHWHAQVPGEKGTVELTLWAAQGRAWIKIQSGRRAPWISEKLPALQLELERHLAPPAAEP